MMYMYAVRSDLHFSCWSASCNEAVVGDVVFAALGMMVSSHISAREGPVPLTCCQYLQPFGPGFERLVATGSEQRGQSGNGVPGTDINVLLNDGIGAPHPSAYASALLKLFRTR